MNLQEILLKQVLPLFTLKTKLLPKRNADTWEEKFSYRLVKLYAILMPLALLVTLLALIQSLLLVPMLSLLS